MLQRRSVFTLQDALVLIECVVNNFDEVTIVFRSGGPAVKHKADGSKRVVSMGVLNEEGANFADDLLPALRDLRLREEMLELRFKKKCGKRQHCDIILRCKRQDIPQAREHFRRSSRI